jgi:hypothetical protein
MSSICGSSPLLVNPLMNTNILSAHNKSTNTGGNSSSSSAGRVMAYVHSPNEIVAHSYPFAPDASNNVQGNVCLGPTAASIAGNMVRTLRESCFPQTLIPRGAAGAGKSELTKEVLQLVVFAGTV